VALGGILALPQPRNGAQMRLPVLALLLFLPVAGQTTVASQPTAQGSVKTTQSLTELRTMAEQGDADAQLKIGDCYAKGNGVKKDFNEAVRWHMKSAEQGNPQAQVNIGQDYAYGWGLPKSSVEAEKWFRKSADQGYAEAQHQLFYWYSLGVYVPKDETEAIKWCRKAAEQGHAEAQYDLGGSYELEGFQSNQDALLDAYGWYCLAAANGHKHAAMSRDSLAKNLYPQALVRAKLRAKELFGEFPPNKAQLLPVSNLTAPNSPHVAKTSSPLTKGNSKRPPVPGATENQQGLWEADMDLGQCRMLMVLIPTGSFMMVTPSTGDFVDNKPDHKVTISRRFWMGKYDVTQAQWEAVMGSNPSHFRGADLPVEQVSWDDCQLFISRLNAKGKGSFRLPTEAEWEYACLAGTTDDLFNFSSIAWFEDNSGGDTNPVGTKEPNAFGLYDMVGNVCQWCQDSHQGDNPAIIQGTQEHMSGPLRVIRGSDWRQSLTSTHMAVHEGTYSNPGWRSPGLGFRLLRTIP